MPLVGPGTARFGHFGVEVVRDNADIAATAWRFGQATVEIVHDALLKRDETSASLPLAFS